MNWGRRSGRESPGEAPPPGGPIPAPHPPAAPIPHQADPLAGVVEDTRPFFLPRRGPRRRRDDWADPAAAVAASAVAASADPAPVAGSPMADRVRLWRRRFLPLPEEVVEDHLGSGEKVLHIDHPSARWFLVSKAPFVGALVVVLGLVVYALVRGNAVVASILWLVAVALVVVLAFKRVADRYTSYVITNARMIRMSGIVSRSVESIPWIRVTDVHFRQSRLERLLGYATLKIESANESMGLRELSGVADPLTFNRHLMDMVVAKQGPSVPLGRRSDYAILPPPRGFLGRRQRRELVHERSAVTVEEPAEAAAPEGVDDEPAAAAAGRDAPRSRPVTRGHPQTVAPDPPVGADLSDLSRTAEQEIAADRRRQAPYYESYPEERDAD